MFKFCVRNVARRKIWTKAKKMMQARMIFCVAGGCDFDKNDNIKINSCFNSH